jgi:hypothetical protein
MASASQRRVDAACFADKIRSGLPNHNLAMNAMARINAALLSTRGQCARSFNRLGASFAAFFPCLADAARQGCAPRPRTSRSRRARLSGRRAGLA